MISGSETGNTDEDICDDMSDGSDGSKVDDPGGVMLSETSGETTEELLSDEGSLTVEILEHPDNNMNTIEAITAIVFFIDTISCFHFNTVMVKTMQKNC